MAKRIKTIFQVRRALSEEWDQINPILRVGEPGFAIDTQILKIGNGVARWKDLPDCGSVGVAGFLYVAPRKADFPLVGDEGIIYRSQSEHGLYQWNEQKREYEELVSFSVTDIDSINGGNASG